MNDNMKQLLYIWILLFSCTVVGQQKKQDSSKSEVQHIYDGNQHLKQNAFIEAEAEYRKAIDKNDKNAVAKYNLGNAYYKEAKTDNALQRYLQAQKVAKTKPEKHKAFHNLGNTFMKQKKYEEAIEAYKNALRNNPTDNETRYNLALAKKLLEDDKKNQDPDKNNQNNQNKDQDKQNKDQDKKDSDKNEDDEGKNEEQKEGGDKDDDKKGDDDSDKKNENKKDKKDDKKPGEGDQKKEDAKPKQQQGQLSPQQVQQLLNRMNDEEKKVQDKMNKQKGILIETEKDW